MGTLLRRLRDWWEREPVRLDTMDGLVDGHRVPPALTEESDYGAWINKVRRSHRDGEDFAS